VQFLSSLTYKLSQIRRLFSEVFVQITDLISHHLASERGAEKLLELFAQVDDIEATLYHDIAKGRIEVIRAFKGLVDANEKEKVLQKLQQKEISPWEQLKVI